MPKIIEKNKWCVLITLLVFCILTLVPYYVRAGGPILSQRQIVMTGANVYTTSHDNLPAGTGECLIGVSGGDIRWNMGTDPEADNGPKLLENAYITLTHPSQIIEFRMIVDSGSSAVTAYQFFYGKDR